MWMGQYSYIDLAYRSFYPSASQTLSLGSKSLGAVGGLYSGWTGGAQLGNFLVAAGLILFPAAYRRATSLSAKLVLTVCLGAAFLALYYTQSMGNWLALVVALPMLVAFVSRRIPATAMMAVIGLVIGLWLFYLLPQATQIGPPGVGAKLADLRGMIFEGRSPEYASVRIRGDLIAAGWWMFTQSPAFGMGFSTYGRYAPQSGYSGVTELGTSNFAHNSYAAILGELGLVGTLLFLAFIVAVFRTALINIRSARDDWVKDVQIGAAVAIAANLVFFADYETWAFNLNFWLPVGLTLAIRRLVAGDATPPIAQGVERSAAQYSN